MKARIIAVLSLLTVLQAFPQDKMYIHLSDHTTLGAPITTTDSIYFDNNGTTVFLKIGDTLAQYPVNTIDSITFGPNSNTIYITYSSAGVDVINPLAFEGVSVMLNGSDVTVKSSSAASGINFHLDGTTSDGSFKIYTAAPYNLWLDGVNITNPDGPALNVQSKKRTSVTLVDGTTSILMDGASYAVSAEDQKGVFFSEAKLVFSGSGALNINGNGTLQHGICSDKEIVVDGGHITVSKAVKDGIHASEGITVTGGYLNITSTGDGLDAETAGITISGGDITTVNSSEGAKGIVCDSTLVISGGTLNITVTGNQSKGIRSKVPMTLCGGNITITNSGAAVLVASGSGYDPSYCTAIKCDEDVIANGSDITITTTGKAGKGISSDKNILITGGNIRITNSGNGATYVNTSGVTDAYMATCLSSDGRITINGGTVITSSSGSAGRGISADGQLFIGTSTSSPTVQITTTGAKVLISGFGPNASYAEAKAVKCDSAVHISNGNISISSADDGIKSLSLIEISQAALTISNSYEGMESPFITINSGNVNIKSSDDCLNATFGGGGETNDGSLLTIAGGTVVANTTSGDGLDSNGSIQISGGTTIVHGPSGAPEVGMDYNGTCNINGGLVVISSPNSNMVQAPSNTSAQYSVLAKSNQALSATTLFHVQDASGASLVTFQPVRTYYSVMFSSADLHSGSTYSIYTGGSCTGTNNNGLYSGGTYSGGTLKKTFTISNKVTNVTF